MEVSSCAGQVQQAHLVGDAAVHTVEAHMHKQDLARLHLQLALLPRHRLHHHNLCIGSRQAR